jgi:hypothetical protein
VPPEVVDPPEVLPPEVEVVVPPDVEDVVPPDVLPPVEPPQPEILCPQPQ